MNKVICSNADECPFTGCEHASPHDRDIDCVKGTCSATGMVVQCVQINDLEEASKHDD